MNANAGRLSSRKKAKRQPFEPEPRTRRAGLVKEQLFAENLTSEQIIFCAAYVESFKVRSASEAVGRDDSWGSRQIQNTQIQDEIRRLMDRRKREREYDRLEKKKETVEKLAQGLTKAPL